MSDDKMKIKAVNDLKNVKRSLRKNSLYIACSFNLDLNESHIYNNIIYSTNYTHIVIHKMILPSSMNLFINFREKYYKPRQIILK